MNLFKKRNTYFQLTTLKNYKMSLLKGRRRFKIFVKDKDHLSNKDLKKKLFITLTILTHLII